MAGRRRVKSGDWWRVLYRIGTPDRCRWIVVIQPFRLHSEAMREGKRWAKKGHRAVLMRDKHLAVVGPPVGWKAEDSDAGHFEGVWWIRDKVEAEPKPAV